MVNVEYNLLLKEVNNFHVFPPENRNCDGRLENAMHCMADSSLTAVALVLCCYRIEYENVNRPIWRTQLLITLLISVK
jgi:hypothetical protein